MNFMLSCLFFKGALPKLIDYKRLPKSDQFLYNSPQPNYSV